MKSTTLSALAFLLLDGLLILPSAHAANPSSHALTVHEWGVEEFDWDINQPLSTDLPDFIYTDRRPGKQMMDFSPENRVRDQRPGDGRSYPRRAKPILYFYGDGPMDVEMRFAQGHAIAWWPQATVYRTPENISKAKAPDWAQWWTTQANLRRGFKEFPGNQPAPLDERFDLAWNNLTLSITPPEGSLVAGTDLPSSHWIRRARLEEIASERTSDEYPPAPMWVSNGKETERYLFYEGQEPGITPAITLLPAGTAPGTHHLDSPFEEKPSMAVVNTSRRPLHDVIVIFRNSAQNLRWSTHIPILAPGFDEQSAGWLPTDPDDHQATVIRIPDSSKLRPDPDEAFFHRMLREKAFSAMTDPTGANIRRWGTTVLDRDPALPGRTLGGTLFPAEANALLDIWDKEFFMREGLTILYRESPEALDAAMPLHVFTTVHEEAQIQRVGWVVNHHLPMHQEIAPAFRSTEESLASWLGKSTSPKDGKGAETRNDIREKAKAWLIRQKENTTLKAGMMDWLLMDQGLPPLRDDLATEPPIKAPCLEKPVEYLAKNTPGIAKLEVADTQQHQWNLVVVIVALGLPLAILLAIFWKRRKSSDED